MPTGIANLEETSLPRPEPPEFPHGETLAPLPSGSLSISGGSGWERQKGCGRQEPAQAGGRLEHPLRALGGSLNSRGSLM